MNLTRKSNDVLAPLSDFFDVDRFFSNTWSLRTQSVPSVNIRENDNSFIIELAAAGMDKGDFKINVEDDVLTISAERKQEKKEDNEKYARREFSYNSFSRSFSLPDNVDTEKTGASYQNGVLSVQLPKKAPSEHKKTRQVNIT